MAIFNILISIFMPKIIFSIRILMLAIAITIGSCSKTSSVHYADLLADCLAKNDVLVLNEACASFESQLKNRYKGKDLRVAYQTFLTDFQQMNIAPEFFVNSESKKVLAMIRDAETFDKIWVRVSYIPVEEVIEIPPIDESVEPEKESSKEKTDPFCTNPNGLYLDCLLKKNKNSAIADYLETTKSIPGISQGITAGVLSENLTADDYNKDILRLIISIGFYYELSLLIQKE